MDADLSDIELLPQTFQAALRVFGPAVYNENGRTRKALAMRVGHCRRTWADKFGPLNAEQEAYADTILAYALGTAAKDAGGNTRLLYPYTQRALGHLVNHEDVHAGFKRRAPKLVDVTDTLRELVV